MFSISSKRRILALSVVLVTTSALLFVSTRVTSQTSYRAMWVWNRDVVTNPASRDELFAFAQSKNITGLYLSAGGLLDQETELADFIAIATGMNIEVEMLTGAPEWALEPNHHIVLSFVGQVITFTHSVATGAVPIGVHLDIEPYLLTEWDQDQASVIAQYLDLLANVKQELNAQAPSLALIVDIPFWYDTIDATYDSETKPLSEHVQDIADRVVLMDYRDFAQGSDGIIEHALNEMGYALRTGQLATIGVQTDDVEPEKVTFFEEGERIMEEELATTRQAYESYSSFHGFAIHNYRSYKVLCPWTTDSVHDPATCVCRGRISINSSPLREVENGEIITVEEGDTFAIPELWYCSPVDGAQWDLVTGEAYYLEDGVWTYADGLYIPESVPVSQGCNLIGAFNGNWILQRGMDNIVITLIHYYNGGYEIDGQLFINLSFCILPGDFDGDGDVDMADILLVASHWHTAVGDPDYVPLYDTNGNGYVDIVDIMLVAIRWGDRGDH